MLLRNWITRLIVKPIFKELEVSEAENRRLFKWHGGTGKNLLGIDFEKKEKNFEEDFTDPLRWDFEETK